MPGHQIFSELGDRRFGLEGSSWGLIGSYIALDRDVNFKLTSKSSFNELGTYYHSMKIQSSKLGEKLPPSVIMSTRLGFNQVIFCNNIHELH